MLTESLNQIKQRGGAQPGDKTLVDTLDPAVNELKRGVQAGLKLTEMFQNAARKETEGTENTKTMVARHGRAKYVGDKSLGLIDPGAAGVQFYNH